MDYSLPCFCYDYSTDEDGLSSELRIEHRLGADGCKYPPRCSRDDDPTQHDVPRTGWVARALSNTLPPIVSAGGK